MKMKRIFFVAALLFCIAFSSVSFAVTKWACVGDSITAGWKLKDPQMYYYKLGVMLGSEYEVRNYGHSARTMLREPNEGVSYWISPMFTDSQAWYPDIVTIMLGTNDAHPNNWPMLAAEYEQDAIDMVNAYKGLASNPLVILMKVPPARNDGREPALSEVNKILECVAQVTRVKLVDVYSAIDNSHPVPYSENNLYKDPIHLSEISHTIIADLLYDQFINGPVCGDANCDFGEDQCNCPEDCGTPPETESVCDDGVDEDCDCDMDCDDVDCDGNSVCLTCGDAICDSDLGEDQCSCESDCGEPPAKETNCSDGINEDCDSNTDCEDEDCYGNPSCSNCLPQRAACTDNAECCSSRCLPAGKCAK
jgi:lysophospholipase L1-like esterase